MSNFSASGILGFDHVDFAVTDLEKVTPLFLRLGFEKAGVRELKERGLRSILFVQNDLFVIASQSSLKTDPLAKFAEAHGDGIYQITFRCKDAMTAFEIALQRGALMADGPKTISREHGEVHFASIKTIGDVRHGFVSRSGTLFAEGFEIPVRTQSEGTGLKHLDHFGGVVAPEALAEWTQFYEQVLGLTVRPDHPFTVLESPDGAVKLTLNDNLVSPHSAQEFFDVNHGAGIQHLAFNVAQLPPTIKALRKAGLPFVSAEAGFYQEAAEHLSAQGNLAEFENLGIFPFRDGLQQSYTTNVLGPAFFEFVQRNGSPGYGEPIYS